MSPAGGAPIASLDTGVSVASSVAQIQALVQRFGAAEFTTSYDHATGLPTAVAFKVRDPHFTPDTGGPQFMPVALRAPCNTVYEMLKARRKVSYMTEAQRTKLREQAERVAWRNLHDFVRASLIGVQTGIMSLGEAFMASLVVTLPTGEAKRLGDIAAEGQFLHGNADGRLRLGSGS